MPFRVTWMALEITILSEVRERQICDITYMWTLKNDTNELIYETDSQTQRMNLWLPAGKIGEKEQAGTLGLTRAHCYI